MKKITFLLIIFIFSLSTFNFLNAQNNEKVKLNKIEKKLVGTWVLSAIEVENMEEYAKPMLDLEHEYFDDQIEVLEGQLELIEDEDEKGTIQQEIKKIEAEKSEMTLESKINELNTIFADFVGKLKLEFYKDKKYKSIAEDEETGSGTWFIDKKKSELHTTESNYEQVLSIITLSKIEVKFYAEEGEGESLLQFNMIFKKINN